MTLRITTASKFTSVYDGIATNLGRMLRAQEQLASGRRILRPSDDALGTARLLRLNGRRADLARFAAAGGAARPLLDAAASSLQDASGALTKARELLIQGMNGTLSADDREAIATELDVLRDQMIELANGDLGGTFLFGGTKSGAQPWSEVTVGGKQLVVYGGNGESNGALVGDGVTVAVGVPGSDVFAKLEHAGTAFAGLTGVASGTTADEGVGFADLELAHTATSAPTLGTAGVALANGGADDTLLGEHELVIDPVAGTIQLGSGPALALPDPTTPDAADFVVENEHGGSLHLDLSGYAGAAYTGTVRGDGTIALGGGASVALDFAATDLELTDDARGTVLHVDLTSVGRAGVERAQFAGTVDVFEALQSAADDLRNGDGLSAQDLVRRLELSLGEIERNHENVLGGLSTLGARSARLADGEERLAAIDARLVGLVSDVEDVDVAEAVIELAQAEQTLNLAQATGARLMQQSLLEFL